MLLFLFNFWELLKEKARNAQKGLSIKRISIALIILGVVYLIRTVWTQNSTERIRSPTRSIQPREVYLLQVENLHRIGRSRFNYSQRRSVEF